MGAPSPVTDGIKGLCPECGEGTLFSGFLTFSERCEACGADFGAEDTGDGPAVFVIFALGIFVIPLVMAVSLIFNLSMVVTLLIFTPFISLIGVALLRWMRGVMFSLQWANKAVEHKAVKPKAAPAPADINSADINDVSGTK